MERQEIETEEIEMDVNARQLAEPHRLAVLSRASWRLVLEGDIRVHENFSPAMLSVPSKLQRRLD
jgi:hypothetical protein